MEAILKKAGEYLETRMEIVRLKTVDKSSEIISTALSELVMIIVIGLSISILSVGLSILIGSAIGAMYLGFFIVGGCYAFVAIFLFVFRKEWLRGYFRNLMLDKILS